jgi:hypothetical protein
MTIDRSEVNRALAKALAYQQCGKPAAAALWAAELVRLLECHGILRDDAPSFAGYGAEVAAEYLETHPANSADRICEWRPAFRKR